MGRGVGEREEGFREGSKLGDREGENVLDIVGIKDVGQILGEEVIG